MKKLNLLIASVLLSLTCIGQTSTYPIQWSTLQGVIEVPSVTSVTIEKNAGVSKVFDAGAYARNTLLASVSDGWIELTAGATNQMVMLGFTQVENVYAQSNIELGFHLKNNGTFQVWEGSAAPFTPGSYQIGDKFRIWIKGNVIEYYHNWTAQSTPFYTSLLSRQTGDYRVLGLVGDFGDQLYYAESSFRNFDGQPDPVNGNWLTATTNLEDSWTSGKVGIKVDDPSYELEVNGVTYIGDGTHVQGLDGTEYRLYVENGIRTNKVKVDLESEWADYVFADDYPLATLQEVDKFIKEHHHLPNIPSAAEVERDGVELGAMNILLLEKIEELTLHMIQLNKEIEALKAQLNVVEE